MISRSDRKSFRQSSHRVTEAWQEPNMCSQKCGKAIAELWALIVICCCIKGGQYLQKGRNRFPKGYRTNLLISLHWKAKSRGFTPGMQFLSIPRISEFRYWENQSRTWDD